MGKKHHLVGERVDDIPEALRDTPEPKVNFLAQVHPIWWLGGSIFVIAITLTASILTSGQLSSSNVSASSDVSAQTTPETQTQSSSPEISPELEQELIPTEATLAQQPKQDQVLGHFAYEEALIAELQPIYQGSSLRLRSGAAQKFREMVAAASASGISLVPISGFRSLEEQRYLFFGIKEQRSQDTSKRAEVSAPPGYSEHHTGYAVDIGDGRVPGTNLSPSFETTAAFAWLQQNAPRYSFELSFPRDNPQGINYEPWHWRYVGDQDSLETFYKNRDLTPN